MLKLKHHNRPYAKSDCERIIVVREYRRGVFKSTTGDLKHAAPTRELHQVAQEVVPDLNPTESSLTLARAETAYRCTVLLETCPSVGREEIEPIVHMRRPHSLSGAESTIGACARGATGLRYGVLTVRGLGSALALRTRWPEHDERPPCPRSPKSPLTPRLTSRIPI